MEKTTFVREVKKRPKIAFTGPECSGKTTLSTWLALELDCTYSPEFAREYLSKKSKYTQEDLDEIAQGQFVSNTKKDISDTEMLVMEIWSKVKYGQVSEKITTLLHEQHFDLYFLCRPDFAWEQDPLRENPYDREQLFEQYVERLLALNIPFEVLEGSIEKRQQKILNVLEKRIK